MLGGKVVVVTGASRGLGRALALAFAREGVHLVINSRSRDSLGSVAGETEETGAEVLAVSADVSVGSDVERLVDEAVRRFGRRDGAGNTAGALGRPRARA